MSELTVKEGRTKKYGVYLSEGLLFESNSGCEALQWAINFDDKTRIQVDKTIDMNGSIYGHKKIISI